MPRPPRAAAIAGLLTTLLVLRPIGARAADARRDGPTLAIVDFEVTPGGWTLPPPQIGATVADLLLDQLVNAAPYHVLDGRWLQPEGARQNRGRGFETLRRTAEESGVDYLVLGSVTRFSAETTRRNFAGGGFGAPIIGGYGGQSNTVVVSLSARVVDVRTGEIVTTGLGDGSSKRRRFALGALGLLHLPGGAAFSSGAARRSHPSSRDRHREEPDRGGGAIQSVIYRWTPGASWPVFAT